MNAGRRLLLSIIAVFALTPVASMAEPASPLTIFAAASLKNALDDVGAAFHARTGQEARISYGASSTLARQIEAGAPADIFISADVDWMDYLAQRGLIVAASRRNLLTNHLALIAPVKSTVRLRIGKGMPLAAALGSGRLAVAGPSVPAGKYAKASLQSLGVWASVAERLTPADNVRGALLFVEQGATPLGIVYVTDAKIDPKVRIVGLFPDASHPPIVYPAALTHWASNRAARAFLAFAQGPQATAIFRKYGFIVLGRPR